MWQIIISIYVIVLVLSSLLLWAALAQSKKADQNTERHSNPVAHKTIRIEDKDLGEQFLTLPAFSEHSKK
jgi:hypothetical protein